ncbi:GAP family protein [Nostocoides sp. F2B08]|uniref:GAP family protein n=1 Tax=Nostocoides sp. F2B08 TaxID=2653936 RepID=UPI00186B1682|nr:GAP family protein [Tetrasphaera sp. F2B08]
MTDLVAELVPIAVAIALSPFPVIPVVLLLLTDRALPNGGAFLGGWFGGLLGLTAALTVLAGAIELWDEAPTWAAWARVVLGAGLVALGVRSWFARGRDEGMPAWMDALDGYTPARSARLGLLLAVANPKSVVLVLAGAVTIGSAAPGLALGALAAVVFAALAASAVALPVLLRLILGTRVVPPLERLRRWLVEHNDAIVAVILVVLGVLLARAGWAML